MTTKLRTQTLRALKHPTARTASIPAGRLTTVYARWQAWNAYVEAAAGDDERAAMVAYIRRSRRVGQVVCRLVNNWLSA